MVLGSWFWGRRGSWVWVLGSEPMNHEPWTVPFSKEHFMAVLERVATLVRANLNDLIDRAEDPEKMLKQVILDMENQYLQVKTQVAVSIADQHMLEKKWKENEDTGN